MNLFEFNKLVVTKYWRDSMGKGNNIFMDNQMNNSEAKNQDLRSKKTNVIPKKMITIILL